MKEEKELGSKELSKEEEEVLLVHEPEDGGSTPQTAPMSDPVSACKGVNEHWNGKMEMTDRWMDK